MKSLVVQQLVLLLICRLALADVTRSQHKINNDAMDDDDDSVEEVDAGGADVIRHHQLKELLIKQLTVNREVNRPPEIGRNNRETEEETEEEIEEEVEEENEEEIQEEDEEEIQEENEEGVQEEDEEDIQEENEEGVQEEDEEEIQEENEEEIEDSEDENEDYDPYTMSFHDQQPDGSYVYGYSLPDGMRRYERSSFSGRSGGRVVEGFYTQARHYNQRVVYELRCYRSDIDGFRPLSVEYLERPPTVRRDREPDVDCFA